MRELNHIILKQDLLSGSSGPVPPPTSSLSPVVFDLRAGGLFKVDSPNADRAQVASLEVAWSNS